MDNEKDLTAAVAAVRKVIRKHVKNFKRFEKLFAGLDKDGSGSIKVAWAIPIGRPDNPIIGHIEKTAHTCILKMALGMI